MSDLTSQLSVALADRYRIERRLGEGGMATVYLAEDLKHKRKVALKVLRPELAAVLGAERFVQEITTTASLQHPHILPLFDSGTADGFLYYVMPFIDGETLRDKLNREQQLSIDEGVRIAREVADALDYAHRNGVIHRDIKPENILLHDGRPMVADFGIALAVSAAAGGRMTETGLSLGTPHYMSPEQATGEKDITARSDVYSLASVLYETLAGAPPHVGGSAQQVIMRIVTEEAAPVTKHRRSVPAHVAAALAQGLEKLPADRFASAAAFAAALGNPAFTATRAHTTMPAAPEGTRRSWIAVLAVTNVVLLATVLWLAVRAPGGRVMAYDVGLPDSAPLGRAGYMAAFDVAPDGAFAVYSAHDSRLWYRDLRGLESYPLAGAAGFAPAIAPNGSQVAFFSDGQVKVTPVAGGSVTALSESPSGSMIRWLSDTELFVVEGDGARARWLDVGVGTVRTQDLGYCLFATPLPSGRFLCGGGGEKYGRLLDTASLRMEELRVGSVPGDTTAPLLRGSDFRLLDDAYLTFVSIEGEIRAVPFDPTSHQVGRVVTLQPGVRREAYSGTGQYRVMATGTLVYAPGPNTAVGRMVRTRPDGRLDSLPIEAAEFLRYDMAPDGRTLAAAVDGVQEQELRIYDLETGRRQVWLRGVEVGEPHWASADRLIVNLGGDVHDDPVVVVGEPTASSPPDTVHRGTVLAPVSYGPGERVVGTGWESFSILALDLSVAPATLDTLVDGGLFGGLSPDGRWLSYTTFDFSETLLMPFPALGQRFVFPERVSEIQWLSPTEAVGWTCCTTWYRFEIRADVGNPIISSRVWHRDVLHADTPGLSYTLSPEGELVYVRGPDTRGSHYLRVVPGWVERMKQAVAEANR